MATSLQELLDLATATASEQQAKPGKDLHGAEGALRHIGRAISRLSADGLDPEPGSYRERFANELANVCLRSEAVTTPGVGPLNLLCGAAADQAGLIRPELNNAARWAAVLAFTETARHIAAVLAAQGGPNQARALRRACVLIERTGAIEPPGAPDMRLLHRQVPWPAGFRTPDRLQQAHEAMSALVHYSRPATPLTVSEVLAVTIAAETTCRYASTPQSQFANVHAAADEWRSVRTELQPFNDGSRRYQHDRPPIILAALALHDAMVQSQRLGSPQPEVSEPTAVAAPMGKVLASLPVIADNLSCQVNQWARGAALHAYAADLPSRYDRLGQQSAGHNTAGLVRADALDLAPVTRVLRRAELLSSSAHAERVDVRPSPRESGDLGSADQYSPIDRQRSTNWKLGVTLAAPVAPHPPPSSPRPHNSRSR